MDEAAKKEVLEEVAREHRAEALVKLIGLPLFVLLLVGGWLLVRSGFACLHSDRDAVTLTRR